MFITFEGTEGSGKTTIINKIIAILQEEYQYAVILTREPGGSSISEAIRQIILDPKNKNMQQWTEALLYIAARKQHLEEKIIPLLQQRKIVLCDRFSDSTIAYQGFGRGLAQEQLLTVQKLVFDNFLPDLTLFLDIEPEKSLLRLQDRDPQKINRLDLEKLQFHQKVYQGYLTLAKHNPKRIHIINARNPIETVVKETLAIILAQLK